MSDDARLTEITTDMARLYAELKDVSVEGLTEAERAELETRVLCVTEHLEIEYRIMAFGDDVPYQTQAMWFDLQRFVS
jgi:hypothetical protein